VRIKLSSDYVRNMQELKVFIVITNVSGRAQAVLFDKPFCQEYSPFGTQCFISNAGKESVLALESKERPDAYTAEALKNASYYLNPNEWIMKSYAVTDLVVFKSSLLRNHRLPSGSYTLQLSLWGNLSNVVSFRVY
jgi:hypothetical protein